jgi:hypothetical protein
LKEDRTTKEGLGWAGPSLRAARRRSPTTTSASALPSIAPPASSKTPSFCSHRRATDESSGQASLRSLGPALALALRRVLDLLADCRAVVASVIGLLVLVFVGGRVACDTGLDVDEAASEGRKKMPTLQRSFARSSRRRRGAGGCRAGRAWASCRPRPIVDDRRALR